MRLGWESQTVIGLRLMRMAGGGASAHAEAQDMVSEKAVALVQSQFAMSAAVMRGESAPKAAAQGLAVYKERVRKNRRRLSR